MAAIIFEHVRKEYPGQVAVADLSLDLALLTSTATALDVLGDASADPGRGGEAS